MLGSLPRTIIALGLTSFFTDIVGWAVYAVSYFGLAKATSPREIWLFFLIYGFYYGLTEPVEKALVKDLAPVECRGRAFGYYNFILGISALPASVLMGWLWNHYGPKGALGLGAGIAGFASILLVVWNSLSVPTDQPRGS